MLGKWKLRRCIVVNYWLVFGRGFLVWAGFNTFVSKKAYGAETLRIRSIAGQNLCLCTLQKECNVLWCLCAVSLFPLLRSLGSFPAFSTFSLVGLPPIHIEVGECEVLLDQVVAFAARAQCAEVDVRLVLAEDMVHVFPLFTVVVPQEEEGRTPEPFRAFERFALFVEEHIPLAISLKESPVSRSRGANDA